MAPNLSRLCADFTFFERRRTDEAEEKISPTSRCPCSCSLFKQIGLPLILGQLLAGFIAVTAICSALLVQNDVSLPLAQNLFHYCFLSLCYWTTLAIRSIWPASYAPSSGRPNVQLSRCDKARCVRIALYTVTGLVDAHANWAIVAAYAHTSVTSVQLLDCLSIPAAMLLSFLFLRYRFTYTHYIAMIVCLLGAGGMVATDVLANPVGNGTHGSTMNVTEGNGTQMEMSRIILGDFLVILGAMAYAASNVLQQYLVMRYGIVEFLAYAGLAATIPTAIYAAIFERDGIYHLFTVVVRTSSVRSVVFSCLAGYTTSMFLLYSLMPYVLSKTSAVLVNMSLLTADVYALLMGIYLFHNRFHVLYILCFLSILFGVGLFSFRAPVIRTEPVKCCACLRSRSRGARLEQTHGDTNPRPLCVYASGEQQKSFSSSSTENSLVI